MNMKIRTWRCTECNNFAYPNWRKVKEIKVDRYFDGECDLAESLVEKRTVYLDKTDKSKARKEAEK